MIPQHLSTNVEHPTPKEIVEAARAVLGAIDLDPASSVFMNQGIRATRFIGLPDDGLAVDWNGRVFLNPPGGRAENKWARHYKTPSSAGVWWRKLIEEFKEKRVDAAIFVGFTLEILRTTQCKKDDLEHALRWPSALEFPLCVPRDRLCFSGDDPTHANVIIYLGGVRGALCFKDVFSDIGQVRL